MSNGKYRPPNLFEMPAFEGLSADDLFALTARKFHQHDIATKAAAVAFYSMISMVPLLTIVITLFFHLLPLAGEMIARENTSQAAALVLFKQALSKLMPGSAYEVVDNQISRVSTGYSATIISLSLAVAIWTSSSVFATICKTMDQIYEHPVARSFWRLRSTAFIVTLFQSAVFIVSLLTFFTWPIVQALLVPTDLAYIVVSVMEWLLLAFVVLSSFSMLLHIGPSGPRYHPIVTPGATLATPVFLLATWLFRFYVSRLGTYNQMYGSLGGVMILLLWFWITGLVLLTGSAVDSVIAERRCENQNVEPFNSGGTKGSRRKAAGAKGESRKKNSPGEDASEKPESEES